jgi:hypothetical protein
VGRDFVVVNDLALPAAAQKQQTYQSFCWKQKQWPPTAACLGGKEIHFFTQT